MMHYILSCFFGVCLLAHAIATKPEVEMPNAYVESVNGQGNELDYVNAYLNGWTGAINPQQGKDLESSASHKRSYGYGHGGGGGSIIGGAIGSIGGSILNRILRSLSGIGLRLGLNLNNEIYTVPDHYGGGYGGYGHRRMQGYEGLQGGVDNGNDRQQQGGYGQQRNVEYGNGNGGVYGDYIGRY